MVLFALDFICELSQLISIVQHSLIELLFGQPFQDLLAVGVIVFPSAEGDSQVADAIVSSVGGEAQPVPEELPQVDELPPLVEQLRFREQILVEVFEAAHPFQQLMKLLLGAIFQGNLSLLLGITLFCHHLL